MPTPRKYTNDAQRQRAYRERLKTWAKTSVPSGAGKARWARLVRQTQAILQTLQDELETYRDDRSDAWHESERADEFQDMIDRAEEARLTVESILNP